MQELSSFAGYTAVFDTEFLGFTVAPARKPNLAMLSRGTAH